MIREIRREIADPQLLLLPLCMRKLRHSPHHRGICRMRLPQLLIAHTFSIVKVHEVVAERREACRAIFARQFPCQTQMRQSFLEIGKPVEQLPHELMQLK